MPLLRKCKNCKEIFYTKLFFIEKGQGKFCSRACSYESMKNGSWISCFTCKKNVYKTAVQIARSKSKKYFCSKSCQTQWRNKEFSGEKHKNWTGGFSRYRDLLIRAGIPVKCAKCKIQDSRILAVHHIDSNHKNNDVKNLQWLCMNCHHLVHHGNVAK